MRGRRKGRELALQALYQSDITSDASEKSLAEFWATTEGSASAKQFAMQLVEGVLARRAEIDALVESAAENWRLERLSRVDLNVIRIAVHELTAPPPLPLEIAINEAVEISRRFGTGESSSFVNGVLDQVAARLGLKPRRDSKPVESDG